MKMDVKVMFSVCAMVMAILIPSVEAATYSGGTGTAPDPYQIGNAADWITLSATTSDWDRHFVLTGDIDFSGDSLKPVGTYSDFFEGVFEGNTHVLRRVLIDQPDRDYAGLFGCVGESGVIRNLGVEDIIVTGNRYVGGLAGYNVNGTILLCWATGTVTGTDQNVGGLVGKNDGNEGRITSCYAACDVVGNLYVGGLAGYSEGAVIWTCYARSAVTGGRDVGGMCGKNYKGNVAYCYSAGMVAGDERLGGLVGTNEEGMVTFSYWDMNTSGLPESAGGEGRTTDEMTYAYAANTFVGWDFALVWAADEDYSVNDGYPYLRNRISPAEGEPQEGEGEYSYFHPADLNTDWRMVMGEAIAYLAGWQQGSNPMAYAIRAAYIWQGGEYYGFDATQAPPMCWILSMPGEGELEGEIPDTTPPGMVIDFSATAGDAAVTLAWTNPNDEDLARIKILRKQESAPASPTDGTVVYNELGATFTDTNVTNGTEYFYAAFAYDEVGNYSDGAPASATPTSAAARAEVLEYMNTVDGLLVEEGQPNLSPEQLDTLRFRLEASEIAYRSGNACEAATELQGLLSLVQAYRGAAANENVLSATERIYNRTRMLRYNLAAGMDPDILCDAVNRIGRGADLEPEGEPVLADQVPGAVTFGEPLLYTRDIAGETMTEVDIPGMLSSLSPGLPGIPVVHYLIGVPQEATIALSQEFEVAESFKCNLYPSTLVPLDPVDETQQKQHPVNKDAMTYRKDTPFPSEAVTVFEIGSFRDLRLAIVEVAAGQWNPASQQLDLFRRVQFKAEFVNGNGYLPAKAGNPFESGMDIVKNLAINTKAIKQTALWHPPSEVWMDGEEFMIFAHTDFLDAAQRLAEWKTGRGMVTRVIEVGPRNMDTKEEIKARIKNHFDECDIRPSFVLLLGDAEFVPTWTMPRPILQGDMATDQPYTCMDADPIQDIAIGRIPVDTAEQAEWAVDRIKAYEGTPPTDCDFYRKVTLAAQFDCCVFEGLLGQEYINPTWVSEYLRNHFQAAGYSVERIYDVTEWDDRMYNVLGLDSTPRFFMNGLFLGYLPGSFDIAPGMGFDWDNNGNDVAEAINDGRLLVWGICHGSRGGWAAPDFNTNTITSGALHNGEKIPVIFSINCSSGYFDNEIDPEQPDDEVEFVEELWRHHDRGAIGVFAATRTSYTHVNECLSQGYADAIIPSVNDVIGNSTPIRRLGKIWLHGAQYLWLYACVNSSPYSNYYVDQMWLYQFFGDPTVEVWLDCPEAATPPLTVEVFRVGELLEIESDAVNGSTITVSHEIDGEMLPVTRGKIMNGMAILERGIEADPVNWVQVAIATPDGLVTTFNVQIRIRQ